MATDEGLDELLSIGRFARLTGLSIGALRHYDELGILRPAEVDPFTAYRRYRRDQLETARTIRRLRDLELPIDEIRAILATDDPAEQRRQVADHRSRIEARSNRSSSTT
jgi:DNA-binding transcriptional MerR regulator